MVKLVGYRKFESKKDGKTYCIAYVNQDLSVREKDLGFVGQKAVEVFMPETQVDLFKPSDIGKELSFSYDMSGGRAFLVDVQVIK